MSPADTGEAERTLVELRRLRQRTHARAHGGAWLPAAGVAALLLLSIALYRYPFEPAYAITAEYPYWAGLPDQQRSPLASYLFWFLGTPLLIAVIGAWYRWRSRQLGLRVAWWPFAGTALGVLVLLAILAAVPKGPPSDELIANTGFWWQGLLTPLLPIAAALVALARVERSLGLAVAGVWIALLAVWLCGNPRLGYLPPWVIQLIDGNPDALGGELALRPGHYLVLMALPLVIFAAVRARRSRRYAGE
ncbi:hypothetical protein AB0J90_16465 [Micromonospora sp. NPDC049523]|uniref:hypothetical protein n=1 Tax=Micromonospora sp. NPDC049523 TaxID=3155921 RepID=UPI0034433CCF